MSSSNPGDIILDPFFGTGTTGAVAKKMHRQWIGIENDADYVNLARIRIDEIDPMRFSQETYHFPQKRDQPRVPFGVLVERGLLEPGQKLYLDKLENQESTILANGLIKLNEMVGTIHQVAKAILGTPCNGWEHWYFKDKRSNEFIVLDELRQTILSEVSS
jgi:modification methylase